MSNETSNDMAQRIRDDPATSDWLKEAIAIAKRRDCLDALRDVETLNEFCRLRAVEAGLKL